MSGIPESLLLHKQPQSIALIEVKNMASPSVWLFMLLSRMSLEAPTAIADVIGDMGNKGKPTRVAKLGVVVVDKTRGLPMNCKWTESYHFQCV